MEKRKLVIGTYDTVQDGPWTLSALTCPEPAQQVNLVEIPGRNGPLDLSTALTSGEPTYGSRTMTATLETSEGTRDDRTQQVSNIINLLDGRRLQIILPDDPGRYIEGRVSIKTLYNDPVHAAVSVTAVCDPWRYNRTESSIQVKCSTGKSIERVLCNGGRRPVIPQVTVSGQNAAVELSSDVYTWELSAGTYALVDLVLPAYSRKPITCRGRGTVTFTYREGVL